MRYPVVFDLGKNLLFKSVLGHCASRYCSKNVFNIDMNKSPYIFLRDKWSPWLWGRPLETQSPWNIESQNNWYLFKSLYVCVLLALSLILTYVLISELLRIKIILTIKSMQIFKYVCTNLHTYKQFAKYCYLCTLFKSENEWQKMSKFQFYFPGLRLSKVICDQSILGNAWAKEYIVHKNPHEPNI